MTVADTGRETFREVPLMYTNGYLFMVTIKQNAKSFTPNLTLEKVYKDLREKIPGGDWSSIYCIELDKHFRNHIHVLLKTPRKPYFKSLKKEGWHIHFKEMKNTKADYLRGLAYIMKHRGHIDYVREEYQMVSYCHYHQIFAEQSERGLPSRSTVHT